MISSLRVDVEVYLLKVAIAVAILVIGYIVGKFTNRILKKIEERTVARTETELDDLIFNSLRLGVRYLVYGVAVIFAARELGYDAFPVVSAVLVIIFARPVTRIVEYFMKTVEENFVKKTNTKADDVVFPLLNKVVKYAIYVFAVVIALGQLGIEVVPFVAGLGIAGLAIGLAAKDTLANIISGIFIIIDQPFVVGDRIEVWSAPRQQATWGDVIDIGLRSTKIKTTDNIVIVIPNAEIAKRDIINYTAISPQIRLRIPVGISYESDLKKAEEVLIRVAEATKGVSKKPKPQVIVKNFGESSIDLELRIWIDNARERRRITSEIGKKVKEEFDKEGIEIPYPKRHVFLKTEEKS
jgi:small-conductance mechanosensitive channel